MSKSKPSILWFRQDLRLDDNSALEAALERGAPVVPVYIWSPKDERDWPFGAASRWWLHHSLKSLQEKLEKHGSRLIIRKGEAVDEICKLIKEVEAGALYWNRRFEPAAIQQEKEVQEAARLVLD